MSLWSNKILASKKRNKHLGQGGPIVHACVHVCMHACMCVCECMHAQMYLSDLTSL